MAGGEDASAHEQQVVVINEMLCFIVNKRRIMPEDGLIQLCRDFYSDTAVEDAKKTVYAHYADKDESTDRYIKRTGEGKKQKNIRDIMDLLTRKGLKKSVVFAAVDITNMPCVSFNNIDVSALLLRMEQMETEVSLLKKTVSSQETVCAGLHTIAENLTKVNPSHPIPSDTSAVGPVNSITSNDASANIKRPSDNEDGIASEFPTIENTWSKVAGKKPQNHKSQTAATPKPVYRKRNTQIVGKAKNLAIKPAIKRRRLANVFASKLDPDLSVDDLRHYLVGQLKLNEEELTIELIRRSEWHSSFHVKCYCSEPSVFMDCDIWPEDAYVRWWREPKQPQEKQTNVKEQAKSATAPEASTPVSSTSTATPLQLPPTARETPVPPETTNRDPPGTAEVLEMDGNVPVGQEEQVNEATALKTV